MDESKPPKRPGLFPRCLRFLHRFTKDPRTELVVGLMVMVIGLVETFEALEADFDGGILRAHHGLSLYGLFLVLKHIPEVFEGALEIEKALDEERG